MTILNDDWINNFGNLGYITPFTLEQINPASYDMTISDEFIDLSTGKKFKSSELTIRPGEAYLASTIEYFRFLTDIAGTVYLKSSLARKGLDHALAGWIDPGFEGNITLELHSHREITLNAGQRICQVVFTQLDAPAKHPYSGRYRGQVGPTEAR